LKRRRFLLLNGTLLLALSGARWGAYMEGSALEKTEQLKKDFLRTLKLPYRDWKASEAFLSPPEKEQLEPDATLIRRYVSPEGDDSAEIAVIAGHQKKSVHTPAYCMPSGGWEVVSEQSYALPLGRRKIPSSRLLMTDGKGRALMATYFFTDGEFATRSLVRFQGEQLLKRFRGEVPLGALIRIIVPVRTDAAASSLSDRFAQATVPPIMSRIRQVRQAE
jgi:EpsI family protein